MPRYAHDLVRGASCFCQTPSSCLGASRGSRSDSASPPAQSSPPSSYQKPPNAVGFAIVGRQHHHMRVWPFCQRPCKARVVERNPKPGPRLYLDHLDHEPSTRAMTCDGHRRAAGPCRGTAQRRSAHVSRSASGPQTPKSPHPSMCGRCLRRNDLIRSVGSSLRIPLSIAHRSRIVVGRAEHPLRLATIALTCLRLCCPTSDRVKWFRSAFCGVVTADPEASNLTYEVAGVETKPACYGRAEETDIGSAHNRASRDFAWLHPLNRRDPPFGRLEAARPRLPSRRRSP